MIKIEEVKKLVEELRYAGDFSDAVSAHAALNKRAEEIAALVISLDAECRRHEWQSIETAPLDGSLLLLGWWETWPEKVWEQEVSPAGNQNVFKSGVFHHGQATHWMPLPFPPDSTQDYEKED